MRVGAGRLEQASWWDSLLSPRDGSVESVAVTPDLDAAGATSRIDRVTITVRSNSAAHSVSASAQPDTTTSRYVVKSSAESFRGTGRRLPQWRTEKSFYDHVAPHTTAGTPRCVWSEASDAGDEGVLVLEDVAAAGAQLDPLSTADLPAALATYALLHATPAHHGRSLPRHSYLMADDIAAVWSALRPAVARRRPRAIDLYDGVFAAYPRLLDWVRERNTTIVHGDATARNVLRSNDGRLVLVDFGTATRGIPTIDVARLASETDTGAGSRAAHYHVWDEWMQRMADTGSPRHPSWDEYLAGLALCAQFAMFQEVPPWEGGARYESYLRGAKLMESALRECGVIRFLEDLS